MIQYNLSSFDEAKLRSEVEASVAGLSDAHIVKQYEDYNPSQHDTESPTAWKELLSIHAARATYRMTRGMGLIRQTFADAPAHKPSPGIALNAMGRRREAGLIGEALAGYPFDDAGRARVAKLQSKGTKVTKQKRCPHCDGLL